MGSGSSIWLPYFCQEFGYRVTGVDYSQNGVERAKNNLSMAGCKGQIIQSDFWNLNSNFKSQFDILFSFGVIEHFDDPEAVVSYFSSFLKKEGVMITYIPNLTGIIAGPLLRLANREFYETHRIISLETLIEYHMNFKMKILFSSYIQPFDLNVTNLSKFGPRFARLGHAAFAAIDLPILAFCKITGRTLSSHTFSSAILVLAQKEEN
jgi:SAM-dependent methyltransferase